MKINNIKPIVEGYSLKYTFSFVDKEYTFHFDLRDVSKFDIHKVATKEELNWIDVHTHNVFQYLEWMFTKYEFGLIHYAVWYLANFKELDTFENYLQHVVCRNIIDTNFCGMNF